ncbi:methyl-accepting chemotaxis protein [Glaciecola sp. 1036]|uniref:methyl-accepting chemotaxis protein n=1 Tax=Alteromonadaceae TaxID=72275 RepID=UPI003CFFA1F7
MNVLKLFDNIKLPVKMGIFALLSFAGLALPTYYYTELSYSNQSSAELEEVGIEPASQTIQLQIAVAEHRGFASNLLLGDSSANSGLSSSAKDVDQMFDRIQSSINASGLGNGLSNELAKLNSSWESLQRSVSSRNMSVSESLVAHSSLISDLDLLLSQILNTSGLSYDPEASSYHLIIANLQNLPRLADSLSKVRATGTQALSNGNPSAADKITIDGYLRNLTAPLQDYTLNMSAAADADNRFTSGAKAASDLQNSIQRLTDLTRQEIINKEVQTYPSSSYFNEVNGLIVQLLDQKANNVDSLKMVIDERISNIGSSRFTTLSIILGLLIISCVIGFVIIRSIQTSANKLIGRFQSISDNKFDLEFNTHRTDEMGILESELSNLTDKLKVSAEVAVEASKVKQALDASSAAFMMTDKDGLVTYMNDAVYKMLKAGEDDIRETSAQFNVETLLGSRISTISNNSALQNALLSRNGKGEDLRLELGKRTYRVTVCPILDDSRQTIGCSLEWHDMTEVFSEERRIKRMLEALECTSTNVMIANADREITYLNRSVKTMLKAAEADLKKVLPHFNADAIEGQNMDRFHKDPSHQKSMLERLSSTHTTQINVGSRVFRLIANPIVGNDGEKIGYVVEWLDRTKEVEAEREIGELVQASLEGNFEKRVKEQGKEGFMLAMAQGLNQLMTTTETGLNEVADVLMAISEGDLTKRIDSHYKGTFDKLKNYCNTTSDNLVSVISKIREASDTINNASSEIASGNADLSTRTEQQASSLEETASSMEELTSTVRLNAENANQANGLASQATTVASNGGELIQEVVVTMGSINESAQKISDIIGVIDGIAFQTNILALNAAVEAARAGEQGRGFAVVASEVRTLAQRSANAAKDIKDLISDSVTKVESGNELVRKSGETMKEIVVSIQRVNDIMSEIAAASAEQATGIDEVSKAVSQMDEMTQQNAALVEEAAAAAESMRSQASDLNQRVGAFKLNNSDVITKVKESEPDMLSQQFEELPSVTTTTSSKKKELPAAPKASLNAIPALADDDEWESF